MIEKCSKLAVLSLHSIYLFIIIYVIFMFLGFYTELRPDVTTYF